MNIGGEADQSHVGRSHQGDGLDLRAPDDAPNATTLRRLGSPWLGRLLNEYDTAA
jgi:hypothetical protein